MEFVSKQMVIDPMPVLAGIEKVTKLALRIAEIKVPKQIFNLLKGAGLVDDIAKPLSEKLAKITDVVQVQKELDILENLAKVAGTPPPTKSPSKLLERGFVTSAKEVIPEAKVLPIEIKTKAPAYKRVLNRGYITTKDSWGNEYVQIRGKVPAIVKEKGVAPHSANPNVDTELNKFSEGAIQPAKLVKIGTQEGFTKTEMLQFQTSKGKDIFVNREYVNLALKEYPNATFFGSESTKPIALKVDEKTVAVVMTIQEGKFAKDITPAMKPTDTGQVPSPKSKAQAKSIEQAVQEVIPKKPLLKAKLSQELANSRILSSLPPDKQIPVTKSDRKS